MPSLRLRAIVAAASLSLCSAGIASAQDSTPAGGATPAAAPAAPAAPAGAPARRDRNRLTAEELANRTDANLFTLLQGMRPRWLRTRGRASINRPEQVWVYRDGVRMGGVEALRQMQVSQVREVRYMEGLEATQRYGIDHGSGAILVTSF